MSLDLRVRFRIKCGPWSVELDGKDRFLQKNYSRSSRMDGIGQIMDYVAD